MEISVHDRRAVFRTRFSDGYDLVQCFADACVPDDIFCAPIDRRYTALLRRDCGDIWHTDRVLALCTDEVPPFLMCGEDLGGHHEMPFAAEVFSPEIRFAYTHIGTQWLDDEGTEWTCVQVTPEGGALFIGAARGSSRDAWLFPEKPHGTLRRGDICVTPLRCEGGKSAGTSVRHSRRTLRVRTGESWRTLRAGSTQADEALMEEDYCVIDPSTVAADLQKRRPPEGFAQNPPFAAYGEPLLEAHVCRRITQDGAAVIRFSVSAVRPAAWQGYLGLMIQEKCCPEAGRVARLIPGLAPYEHGGAQIDLSRPQDIRTPGLHPRRFTQKDYTDPLSPPAREIDLIETPFSTVCSAAGILPVLDGTPDIRAGAVTEAVTLSPARKSYITFAGAGGTEGLAQLRGRYLTHIEGAVFEKTYPPRDGVSVCRVPYGNSEFLYADFWDGAWRETAVALRGGQTPRGIRTTGDVQWRLRDGTLVLCGTRGSAELELTEVKEGNA